MHPVSFEEFLGAMNENQALELYHQVPLPAFAHSKLLHLFHTYMLIGGMPENHSNKSIFLRVFGKILLHVTFSNQFRIHNKYV